MSIKKSILSGKKFLKLDKKKIRYDLIPPKAMKSMAEVLTYGAKKYDEDNWKRCDDPNIYIAALMRHLEAHRLGELFDSESGQPHMAHVMTNSAFLIHFLIK